MTTRRQRQFHSWRDLPPATVVQVLNHLKAGNVYYPQHFCREVGSIAFASCNSDHALVSAVEGLELAITIADQLSLRYSVYTDDRTTLQGIRVAAIQWLRKLTGRVS